jgi:hypothetical protein
MSRADTGAVWVWKAVESARLIGGSLGRQAFAATWAARTQGPIGGLKGALGWAEMELRGTILWSHEEGPCILEATRHKLRSFVLKAIRRRDLGKAERRKEQQGLQECADVDDCRRILKRLPAQGLQEAARAVATGDVVTRSQSRFWQGHDGSCHCGGGKETVKNFLWSCPFTWAATNSVGGDLGCVNSLPAFQAKLGIPAWDDKLRHWRDNWESFTHSSGAWTSNKIWTDASSFYPRDGALRVVGWACVAWLPGGWAFIRGTMPPGTTVAQGDARAIQEALGRLDPGGVIASDCWAAVCLWLKADRHKADDCTSYGIIKGRTSSI